MTPTSRAIVAAAAYAVIAGRKIAGIFDHAGARHLRIAAECRDNWVQGRDGDRAVSFGGMLPNIYDEGTKTVVTLTYEASKARGYDRASQCYYEADVGDATVQLYDHGESAWFSFTVQTA